MSQDDEQHLTEEANIITISELPGRPFRLTMEVPLFLVMLSLSLGGPAISNILLYRTCVHALNHNEIECQIFLAPDGANTTKQLEEEVQKYTTLVTMINQVIEAVGPAILSLFLGVWSDTYGRKPLVVWPLFGLSLSAMCKVVYSMMNNLGPWWFLLTALPFALTGGFTALLTGAYTYVSDITNTRNRSIRMVLLEVAFATGSITGSLLCSSLIKEIGNVFLLLIMSLLLVIAYAFTNISLTESLAGALEGGICSVLDVLLAREMLDTCFKRRSNKGRTQILLLVSINGLTIFIMYGIFQLNYLYTREKLHWALKDYTSLTAADIVISTIATFLAVVILQRILRVADLSLVVLAFISAIAGNIVTMLAQKSWHMYLASAASMFKGLSAPLIRSHITKSVPLEDIAKVFSLMCLLESLCPLVSPILYNVVYEATIAVLPGLVFALSAVFNTICLVMVIMVKFIIWKYSYEPLQSEVTIQAT